MTEKTRTELAAVWPPTAAIAREAGHEPMTLMKAIRAKCYDCSYFQYHEVRLCEAINCALWPFRAGKNPYHHLVGVAPASGGFSKADDEGAPE